MKLSEKAKDKIISILISGIMTIMAVVVLLLLILGIYYVITGDNIFHPSYETTSETTATEEFPECIIEEDLDTPVG